MSAVTYRSRGYKEQMYDVWVDGEHLGWVYACYSDWVAVQGGSADGKRVHGRTRADAVAALLAAS